VTGFGQFVILAPQIIMTTHAYLKATLSQRPAFYELYNTKAQILARTHPGLVNTQKALLSLWHASDPIRRFPLLSQSPILTG
jgi:hypothetical protein